MVNCEECIKFRMVNAVAGECMADEFRMKKKLRRNIPQCVNFFPVSVWDYSVAKYIGGV